MQDLRLIPIHQCIAWTDNPTLRVADTPLWREFVDHLRTYGQLHPIVVTIEPDGRYRVVDGNRRVTALRQIGYAAVWAIVSPLSFEAAIEAYGLAEQLKLPWTGRQLGEIVRRLGYATARAMLRPSYRRILARAYEQVHDPEAVDALLERWGPRALSVALRFAGDDWPLERVLAAMLSRPSLRDLEDRLKGVTTRSARVAMGRAILAAWEQAAKSQGHEIPSDDRELGGA